MNSLVSESRIEHDIRELASAPRNSRENPAGHAEAAEWIAAEFKRIGLVASRQSFEIPGQTPPRQGINVIGTLNGRTGNSPVPRSMLIGAHYDTVPGSPGADDNASGVVALLECARTLASEKSDRAIAFVAFDAEEMQTPAEGLHGSTAYVARLTPYDTPGAAIIFESVGFTSTTEKQRLPGSFRFLFRRTYKALVRQNFSAESLLILSRGPGRAISRELEKSAATPAIQLPILPLEVPRWMPMFRNLRRSDHAPFWDKAFPALMITDTAFFRHPNYHGPNDTADTLDYAFMAELVRSLEHAFEAL